MQKKVVEENSKVVKERRKGGKGEVRKQHLLNSWHYVLIVLCTFQSLFPLVVRMHLGGRE